jgi:aldehyde:ferredoxin oxidoreductase
MKGYNGKLLRVNLSNHNISTESIPQEYLEKYIGGSGLAVRYLYDEIPVNGEVFDESNKLFFSVGPLNGTNFPTSGRFNVSCRSPLTGIWLDSSASGKFGHNLKRAGYDAIIIEGKSERPVYLYINNDVVEIRDAAHVWGKMISQSIKILEEECAIKNASCCSIGPAGEKTVKSACIRTDGNRTVGRGGAGALMGSKNLKAIFLYGSKAPEIADPLAFKQCIKEFTKKILENPVTPNLKNYGTGVAMAGASQSGDAPTKNWALGTWDGYGKISGITMAQTILKKHTPECVACPIQCARYVEVEAGDFQMKGAGPEFETLGSFGSLCLNDNLESIAYANLLCNEYGVDTITVGAAIAFAMEAFEKGIINKEDTGGIDLQWGNIEAILAMIRLIANREGIGEILGQGVRYAAQVLGKGSEEFAVHVKGLELPMHDPRAFFGFGPSYATSPRGACHCHGYNGAYDGRGIMPEVGLNQPQGVHDLTGKGFLAKVVQDFSTVIHASIICLFTTYALGPTDIARVTEAVTGYPWNAEALLKAGERIFNLQRAFNNRFGISRADDCLPLRVMTSTIGGPNEGFVPNLEEQLKEYYELRGWEADGRPSRDKLKELDLEFTISDLYA